MIDQFWFGVLVTLAVEGAFFVAVVLVLLAWLFVAIKFS